MHCVVRVRIQPICLTASATSTRIHVCLPSTSRLISDFSSHNIVLESGQINGL